MDYNITYYGYIFLRSRCRTILGRMEDKNSQKMTKNKDLFHELVMQNTN